MTVVGKPPPARAWIAPFILRNRERRPNRGINCQPELQFNPIFCTKTYACRPLASTSNRPGRGSMLSAAPLAVLLTAPACYLTRRWHSSPRDHDSSTSVRCLFWSLFLRHWKRRDPSQHAAKTLPRGYPLGLVTGYASSCGPDNSPGFAAKPVVYGGGPKGENVSLSKSTGTIVGRLELEAY